MPTEWILVWHQLLIFFVSDNIVLPAVDSLRPDSCYWDQETKPVFIMEDGFMKTSDECISYFGVDAERGLTSRQVEDNRKKYGPNGEWSNIVNRNNSNSQGEEIWSEQRENRFSLGLILNSCKCWLDPLIGIGHIHPCHWTSKFNLETQLNKK